MFFELFRFTNLAEPVQKSKLQLTLSIWVTSLFTMGYLKTIKLMICCNQKSY